MQYQVLWQIYRSECYRHLIIRMKMQLFLNVKRGSVFTQAVGFEEQNPILKKMLHLPHEVVYCAFPVPAVDGKALKAVFEYYMPDRQTTWAQLASHYYRD